jgi:hypothetical protein
MLDFTGEGDLAETKQELDAVGVTSVIVNRRKNV